MPYFLKRILYVIPTLLGVNLLVFLLFFLVNTPDDMARQALGEKSSSPEQLLRWKQARGYDLPLFWNTDSGGTAKLTQTIFWQKSVRLLAGDFGISDMTLRPIGDELAHRVWPSLCLCLPIFLASLLCNIALALTLAARRGTILDTTAQFACVTAMSISTLVYIIASQFIFARQLRLVPVSGFLPGWDMLRFLALPVFIGVLGNLGSGVRFYRTIFLEEINRDYVRTARAKGLSEPRVLVGHVLRNALIPILTNVPVQLLMLVMGSMLLENFFSIPGMGGYTITAISAQDFSVVRAMVFLGSALYMAGLLITDLCYSLADPRLRLG